MGNRNSNAAAAEGEAFIGQNIPQVAVSEGPSRGNSLRVALIVLSVFTLATLAGTCVFGIYAWNYSNELDVSNSQLSKTTAIIKDVVCEGIIEIGLGIWNITKAIKTVTKGFAVTNGKVLVKVSSLSESLWNYTAEENWTISENIASGINDNIFAILSTDLREALLKLSSDGTIAYKIDLPEGRNWTIQVLPDALGGCLIHGAIYYNDTKSYNSYFLKYDVDGKLAWTTDSPNFVAKSISYHNSQYYLVGEAYADPTRSMAVGTLTELGVYAPLANNKDVLTAHGSYWNGTELLAWWNDAEKVTVCVFDEAGTLKKTKDFKEITRIYECVAGKDGLIICTCESGDGAQLQSIGPNFEWEWGSLIPNMYPQILDVTTKGDYLAIFSQRNKNSNERHQKYLEVDSTGKQLTLKEYKTKDAEIVGAQPYAKGDIYAILGGPVFYGVQTNAEAKAIMFPKKLDLDDMTSYCQ